MNLLIPLLNRPSQELKYAIRSICLHNTIDRCLIVGGKPSWYIGEHLPHPDYHGYHLKEENIRDKTNAGAKTLNGEFLFANDDHFVTAPYPGVHNKGLLSYCLKDRQKNGSYTRMLLNTFHKFGDIPNCDTHCPMIMNTDGVAKTMFEWPLWGIGFKTTYAAMNDIASTFHEDNKLHEIPDMVPIPYFSTYADCKNLHRLAEIFPDKSIFEV